MRVLVVEDEPDLAEGLRAGLSRDGYAVDVALDVAGAYERLTVNEYDVMLLDVNLPDGDGFSLCRDLRQDRIPAWSSRSTCPSCWLGCERCSGGRTGTRPRRWSPATSNWTRPVIWSAAAVLR
jgi:CheY-like chemotaxis protein